MARLNGSDALYQVAIGLIPGLFFGSALLEKRGALPFTPRNPAARIAIALFVVFGVLAEIIAIRGSIDQDVSRLEQRFLVFVIVTGTVAVALASAWPWFAPLLGDRPRRPAVALVVLVLAAIGGAQFWITDSLDDARARRALRGASESFDRAIGELRAAERSETDTRTSLLTAIRGVDQSKPGSGLAALATRFLARLEEAETGLFLGGLPQDEWGPVLRRAFDRIDRAGEQARDRLVELHLSEPETEFVRLAIERVERAASDLIAAQAGWEAVQRDYDAACEAASELGCKTGSED